MSDVKWIKITTDIFNDEKILMIESMPDADAVVVIWFKLLCLAGRTNNHGVLLMNDKIAYTEEMLSAIFRKPQTLVRMALQIFEQYGMIEIMDGVICIPNWEKHQSLDVLEKKREYNRERMRHKREQQKLIASGVVDVCDNCATTVVDQKENKSKKENKSIDSAKHKYGEYQNVLLSDSDMEKLQKEFPDWEKRIENLSEYIAGHVTHYKDHLAVIRSWARKDKEKTEKPKSNTFNNFEQRDYDPDELFRKINNRS